MDLTILGVVGAITVLSAFLLDQTHKLSNESFLYDFLNFLGSALLLIYSISTNSLPFIITNVVWGLFSLKDCISYLAKSKKK